MCVVVCGTVRGVCHWLFVGCRALRVVLSAYWLMCLVRGLLPVVRRASLRVARGGLCRVRCVLGCCVRVAACALRLEC